MCNIREISRTFNYANRHEFRVNWFSRISFFPPPPPKWPFLVNFQPFQSCSAMRSYMKFQNVPHKAGVRILEHVKTTIQIRNGNNGRHLRCYHEWRPACVIVSAISRRANLSHYAVLDKCEKLINAGLVETRRDDRNRKFMITEKGLKFFDEFKNFQNLLESMNLRY